MGEQAKTRIPGTLLPNCVPLMGIVEFGGAGAIANQTGNRDCGVTFTKNATGDYRATIHKGYKRIVAASADMVYPNLATAKSLTAGSEAYIQGVSSAQALGTSPIASFGFATVRPDTGALADPTSGTFVAWTLWVQER